MRTFYFKIFALFFCVLSLLLFGTESRASGVVFIGEKNEGSEIDNATKSDATKNVVDIATKSVASESVASESVASESDTTKNVVDRVIGVCETVLDWLTVERESWSFAIYPAASYGGRTGLSVGIMPMFQLRSENLPRPATVTPSFLVSTKKMFEIQCDVDIYLQRRIDIVAKLETYRLPDDFYAVGNGKDKNSLAEYRFVRRMATADVLKGLGTSGPWRIGLTLDFDYYKISKIEIKDTAQVELCTPLYTDGGGNYGAGVVIGYDSRDNVLVPRSGAYVRLRSVGYARVLGGDHRFGMINLDARKYWGVTEKTVIAGQFYASHTWGDVPYLKMPSCGGTRLGRAIGHNYKYVDYDAWLAQCEWRVPLFWRIGGTIWGAAGNVGDGLKELTDNLHLMGGCGLRFAVFPGKGLNIRVDGGLSSHGDHAIYFNIREAF